MNYIGNQNQLNMNYDQDLMNMKYDQDLINNNKLTNNYGLQNFPINQDQIKLTQNPNSFENLTNDNLINLVNNLDTDILDGTPLNDKEIMKKYKQRNKNNDNTSLIKTLTNEIINNLKENNISLYENNTNNSIDDDKIESISNFSNKKNKKKKEIKEIKETIEDFVVNNKIPDTKNYIFWFFDDCFNYKDFLILFILYFVLSQEMIKDFFSKYFTSLNADNEGKVGVQGVIIYGLILTVLYMLIKKLF